MGRVKIDVADQAFSLYVRNRDNWTCQKCGADHHIKRSSLHCSHFMGRGKEATRFEPLNADAICYPCHVRFGAHPQEHLAWQIERKGQEVVDKLIAQSNTYKKKDRKAEVLVWRAKLKEMGV